MITNTTTNRTTNGTANKNSTIQRFTYHRAYTGPVQAVILDWAGTTIDYGSRAPVSPFIEVFRRRDVAVSPEQARGPMGTAKRDHIRSIVSLETVSEQWMAANGRPWTEDDVQAMYEELVPLQVENAASYAQLIPGTLETIAACRKRGIKIGSSSGYNRRIMDEILPVAREQGYEPDSLLCPEDVPAGRPYPWAMYKIATELLVYPMLACVKVGDTLVDIEEGLNAGAWTVGLARTGSELGLSEQEAEALRQPELDARLGRIYTRMHEVGAHYVVDTIADLPEVLDSIDLRLARGEHP